MALGVPILLGVCSYLVSTERRSAKKDLKKEQVHLPENSGLSGLSGLNDKRVNARFFLGMNAALVLIALVLALVPCAGMLEQSPDREVFLKGLVAIISIAAFAGLGLFYSSVKGDLSWISTYQKREK